MTDVSYSAKDGQQLLTVNVENQPVHQTSNGAATEPGDVPEGAFFNTDLITQVFSQAIFKKRLSRRQKINHFLHSPLAQTIIVSFVILDALVVFAQLYVDLQSEKVQLSKLELTCNPNATHEDKEQAEAMELTIHAYEEALEALHITSLVLLSMFVVEVTTKMVTGWHHFVSSLIEILDACIVIISFILDVLLMIEDVSVVLESIAQILILLRLWRIARIVNGAAVAMDTKWRTKYGALELKLQAYEKVVSPELRDEINAAHQKATDKADGDHHH